MTLKCHKRPTLRQIKDQKCFSLQVDFGHLCQNITAHRMYMREQEFSSSPYKPVVYRSPLNSSWILGS